MIFFEDYERIIRDYADSAVTISYRSSYPKVSSKNEQYLEFVKSHWNYDAKYDIDGTLLEWIDLDKEIKIICRYTKGKQLERFEIYRQNMKHPYAKTLFAYDDNGRLVHELYGEGYIEEGKDSSFERFHEYDGNIHKLILPADRNNKDEAVFTSIFNDKKQLIEAKAVRNKDGIFMWDRFEYNDLGQKIKEISLDYNGIPDGCYLNSYTDKGLDAGYKAYSLPDNKLLYSKQRIYEYNFFGDWITQILIRDGEPQYIYERKIEYY